MASGALPVVRQLLLQHAARGASRAMLPSIAAAHRSYRSSGALSRASPSRLAHDAAEPVLTAAPLPGEPRRPGG
jgi:hypothetical protein